MCLLVLISFRLVNCGCYLCTLPCSGEVDLQPLGSHEHEVRLSHNSREAINLAFDFSVYFNYLLSAAGLSRYFHFHLRGNNTEAQSPECHLSQMAAMCN